MQFSAKASKAQKRDLAVGASSDTERLPITCQNPSYLSRKD